MTRSRRFIAPGRKKGIDMRMIYKQKFLSVLSVLFALASCSGNVDDSGEGLVLVADKTEISADGKETVTFAVTMSGADVTADADIISVADGSVLDGAVFSTGAPGNYGFYAEYQGEISETVTITASGEVSAFKRNYCIVEFTAQQCTFCPDGSDFLFGYFLPERMAGETAVVLAFHSNSMGEDIFYIDGTEEMRSHFGSQDLPSFVFDMRDAGSRGILSSAFQTSKTEYPAHCALSLSSELSSDGKTAEVAVGLTSSVNSSYRVALFVVEDRIQAGQDTPLGHEDDYVHRDVVRSVVTGSWQGDNFGELASGQEVTKEYTVQVDPSWNMDNVTVCAVAYDENGYANNCLSCGMDGGKEDYQFND